MRNFKKATGKMKMRLKSVFLVLLITVLSISGIMNVNAATISNDGEYSLLLTVNDFDADIDGEYAVLVRFNVAEGETKVKLSELTKGIIPFNGKNEFSHWETQDNVEADEELEIANFKNSGNFTHQQVKKSRMTTVLLLWQNSMARH